MFKVEWCGDGFVGLSAKTYYCFDHNDSSNDKYSSKGVSRAFKLTREHYLDVLKTKKSSIQVNKGSHTFTAKERSWMMECQQHI